MLTAISTSSSTVFLSSSKSISNLSPTILLPSHSYKHQTFARNAAFAVRCEAVEVAAAATSKKKKRYEIENLTTWLLKQEQAGHIDAELTIVLSSISLACKQIASLLQRSSIINLTGTQGTINIQGEDQKKLDVISNEVHLFLTSFCVCISRRLNVDLLVIHVCCCSCSVIA